MSTNGEREPEVKPMPRLVVKVDSKPDLDLQMERGTTVMVEYRHDDGVPPPPPPPVDPLEEEIRRLCATIVEVLRWFDTNDVLKRFVCIRLGKPWPDFKEDTIVALIEHYKWPGNKREGLESLLREAQQFLHTFGVPPSKAAQRERQEQ